jgi:hypothetical protein
VIFDHPHNAEISATSTLHEHTECWMAMRTGMPPGRVQIADYADLVVMPTCVLYRLLGKGIRVIGSA